jgi:hypothetical protein
LASFLNSAARCGSQSSRARPPLATVFVRTVSCAQFRGVSSRLVCVSHGNSACTLPPPVAHCTRAVALCLRVSSDTMTRANPAPMTERAGAAVVLPDALCTTPPDHSSSAHQAAASAVLAQLTARPVEIRWPSSPSAGEASSS